MLELAISAVGGSALTAIIQWLINRNKTSSETSLNHVSASQIAVDTLIDSYEKQLENLTQRYMVEIHDLVQEISKLKEQVVHLTELLEERERQREVVTDMEKIYDDDV